MSMAMEIPALEAPRIRKALRHLQRSGRRLIQRHKDWVIVGASKAIVFATLNQEEVALLAAEKLIVAAEGGGHVAAPSSDEAASKIEIVPRTGPWVFDVAGHTRRKPKGAGFASLAIRAQAGEGPLTLRQALAGLRFIADVEQSRRGERVTMDWSGLVVDGRRRRGREDGLVRAGRKATQRLVRVRAELGDGAFALIWSACIDGEPIRRLAKAREVQAREVQRRLSLALEKLAAAYDGVKAYDEAEA